MKEVPLKDVAPGMILARDVLTARGIVHLRTGTELTRLYINQLAEMGVTSVEIFTDGEYDQNSIVSAGTALSEAKTAGLAIVSKKLKNLTDVQLLNPSLIDGPIHRLFNEALDNENNLKALRDLRTHDPYTFMHSIDVAIISGIIGKIAGYDRARLALLVRSGLLHDLGKLVVPPEILNKPGKLTDEEFATIKLHPMAGWSQMMTWDDPAREQLAAVALQHHKKLNGSGYPMRDSGDSLSPLAEIVAIADVYDALTSERSYKVAYKPHIAYKIMTRLSRGQFNPELLESFFDQIAIYPVASTLETSAGFAIVKSAEYGKTTHPRILVFATDRYQLIDEPYEVDLSKDPSITISSVLEDMGLLALTSRLRINPKDFMEKEYPEKKSTAPSESSELLATIKK